MEINLIEREDSEIAWYVEGHQAWRDVREDADEEEGEVVKSAGTDDLDTMSEDSFRVTRQFGYLQQVPTDSPLIDHDFFHRGERGWPFKLTRVRELWESRHTAVLGPPSYRHTRRPMCAVDYPEWYDRVTRCFMINPRIWRDRQGFQGSQGYLPVAVEGLSAAYHQIQESGMAEDDDNVDDALQGIHGILDAMGFPYFLHRPPHPPPATPRTSGAHARRPGIAFVNAAPAPRDGWEPWPRPSGGEDSSFYTSSGSGWEHSFQGHGHTDRTWDHFIQGEGDPHTSTWGHSSQVHDAGGSSWGQSTQSHDAGTSTFGHPSQGHIPYIGASTMGHTTQASYDVPSAWATRSSKEQDDDDEKADPPIQLRQQPRRAVKGNGRLCHTGGRRKVVKVVTLIRRENNRILLRRSRYYMFELAQDSVRASGRELTEAEQHRLLQNEDYISDDYMSDEQT
ncbi:hypothetical protein AgCh_026311 [Apium graveolens]